MLKQCVLVLFRFLMTYFLFLHLLLYILFLMIPLYVLQIQTCFIRLHNSPVRWWFNISRFWILIIECHFLSYRSNALYKYIILIMRLISFNYIVIFTRRYASGLLLILNALLALSLLIHTLILVLYFWCSIQLIIYIPKCVILIGSSINCIFFISVHCKTYILFIIKDRNLSLIR